MSLIKKILSVIVVIIIAFWTFVLVRDALASFIVIILAVLIYFIISYYNSLISARNNVRNSWSKIDIQLNRRVDLIENLVQTVKGYSIHEKETLTEVAEARSRLMNSQSIPEADKMNNQLTSSLANLYAVAERYPDLKANYNFLDLQKELKITENEIAKYRELYNNSVLQYNNLCEQFPSNIIAILFNFNLAEFFRAESDKKVLPNVEF